MPHSIIFILRFGDPALRDFPLEIRQKILQAREWEKLRFGIGRGLDIYKDYLPKREWRIAIEEAKRLCKELGYPVMGANGKIRYRSYEDCIAALANTKITIDKRIGKINIPHPRLGFIYFDWKKFLKKEQSSHSLSQEFIKQYCQDFQYPVYGANGKILYKNYFKCIEYLKKKDLKSQMRSL